MCFLNCLIVMTVSITSQVGWRKMHLSKLLFLSGHSYEVAFLVESNPIQLTLFLRSLD